MVSELDFGDEPAFYSLAELQKFPVNKQLYFQLPINPTGLKIPSNLRFGTQNIPFSLSILKPAGRESRTVDLSGFIAEGCNGLTEATVVTKMRELISIFENSRNPLLFNFYLITEQESVKKIENAQLFVYINSLEITERPGTKTPIYEYTLNMIETERL